MTGRQALLVCRHYFKESAIDRKHTDRRRFEAVKLVGDDVEGFWNTLTYTLQEIDPLNVPGDLSASTALSGSRCPNVQSVSLSYIRELACLEFAPVAGC